MKRGRLEADKKNGLLFNVPHGVRYLKRIITSPGSPVHQQVGHTQNQYIQGSVTVTATIQPSNIASPRSEEVIQLHDSGP